MCDWLAVAWVGVATYEAFKAWDPVVSRYFHHFFDFNEVGRLEPRLGLGLG